MIGGWWRWGSEHDAEQDSSITSYFAKKNKDARDLAISSSRYVTVEYGEDAPNSRGTIGFTYAPSGIAVIGGEAREKEMEEIRRLVSLANLALDRGENV